MHVHLLSFLNPYKSRPDGGSEDIRRRLEALSQHFAVNLYVLDKIDRLDVRGQIPAAINARFYPRELYAKGDGLLWPFPVLSRYNKSLLNQLNADLTQNGGVLICEGLQVYGVYHSLSTQARRQCRAVLRVHNIESSYHQQLACTEKKMTRRLAHQLTSILYKRLERNAYNEFDALHCISADETEVLQEQLGQGVSTHLVPPLVLPGAGSVKRPAVTNVFNICMFGDYSLSVNLSGAEWFLKNVWPHVPSNCQLHIAGKKSELFSCCDNVHIHGFVDDLDRFLSKMHFVALPVLHGAGVKIKTIDAISSGLPVLSTQHAVTGLPDSVVGSVFHSDEPQDHVSFLEKAMADYECTFEQTSLAKKSLLEYCHSDRYLNELTTLMECRDL